MNGYLKKSVLTLLLSQLHIVAILTKASHYIEDRRYHQDALFVWLALFQVLFFALSVFFFIKAKPGKTAKIIMIVAIAICGVSLLLDLVAVLIILMTPANTYW